MADAGAVRVSRDFFDDAAFKDEPLSEREAFLWLIMEASFKDRERRVGNVSVSLSRGQLVASSRFLAKAWTWSEARVRRYLDRLENRRMVGRATDAGVTVITLCNYDKYQSQVRVGDAPPTHQPTRQRRTADANENKDAIRAVETIVSTARKRATPKTRIPSDAVLSDKQRAAAAERGLSDAEAEAQFAKFRDWAVAKGQAYADWDAAWRNWLTSPYFAPVLGAVHPFPDKPSARPRRQSDGERLDDHLDALKAQLAVRRLE